jgi:hypothetical protein
MGQETVKARTGQGYELGVARICVSESSDVEVFILAAVCEENEKKGEEE